MRNQNSRGVGWYAAAAVPGILHAGASLYWGLGGSWLLDTVGQGAVELQLNSPLLATAVLLPTGLLKLTGATMPMLNHLGWLPRPRLWRGLFWIAGVTLILFGATYTVLSWVALAGHFGPVEDPAGLRGHGLIWDPLFVVWGVLLLIGLLQTRDAPGHGAVRRPDLPAGAERDSSI